MVKKTFLVLICLICPIIFASTLYGQGSKKTVTLSRGLILPPEINETITKYWNAFNANDLDSVMTCFSNDAVYQPGDGKTHKGKAEIRAAFEPQFDFAFGAMRFDEVDRVSDDENRKLTIRYICRDDISQMKPRGLVMALLKIVARLVYGEKFGWHGVDVFHFDADGKIKGKFTYAWYGFRPHLQRELG